MLAMQSKKSISNFVYFYFLFTLIVLLPYLRSLYHLSSHNSGSGLKRLQFNPCENL